MSGDLISKIAEPAEADHVLLWIEYDKIKGNLFLEMQNRALEQAFLQNQNRRTM